ncbi:MAG: hypothetical protein TREMPRED_002595 [Tremellales sp. Tagirdzhanova-0007]|nr:MAG: hypothetical protein TREMPRED_002595 [Tremellales sp. Tagirdzhanova-0007]
MIPPSAPVRRPSTHLRRTALENPNTLLPILKAGFRRLDNALEPRRRVLEQKMKAHVLEGTEDEDDDMDENIVVDEEESRDALSALGVAALCRFRGTICIEWSCTALNNPAEAIDDDSFHRISVWRRISIRAADRSLLPITSRPMAMPTGKKSVVGEDGTIALYHRPQWGNVRTAAPFLDAVLSSIKGSEKGTLHLKKIALHDVLLFRDLGRNLLSVGCCQAAPGLRWNIEDNVATLFETVCMYILTSTYR